MHIFSPVDGWCALGNAMPELPLRLACSMKRRGCLYLTSLFVFGLVIGIAPLSAQEDAPTTQSAIDPGGDQGTADSSSDGQRIPFQVVVVDGDGDPVEGARVGSLSANSARQFDRMHLVTDAQGIAELSYPSNLIPYQVFAYSPGRGFDYQTVSDPSLFLPGNRTDQPDFSQPVRFTLDGARTITVRALDRDSGEPLVHVAILPAMVKKATESMEFVFNSSMDEFSRITDEDGRVVFDWLPAWDTRDAIIFQPKSMNTSFDESLAYRYQGGDGTHTIRFRPLFPIRGTVRDSLGRPVGGVLLRAQGAGYQREGFETFGISEADGQYEIMAEANRIYLIVVVPPDRVAAPQTGFALLPGEIKEGIDFQLQDPISVSGRLTSGPDRLVLGGETVILTLKGKSLEDLGDVRLPNPDPYERHIQPRYQLFSKTDSEGRYQFHVGPGDYELRAPTPLKPVAFELTSGRPFNHEFHLEHAFEGPFEILATIGQPPKPAQSATIRLEYHDPAVAPAIDGTTDAEGRFAMRRRMEPALVKVVTPDDSHVALVDLGTTAEPLSVSLKPATSFTGRLVDEATGSPLVKSDVNLRMVADESIHRYPLFMSNATTDEEGRFRIDGLPSGRSFRLGFRGFVTRDGKTIAMSSSLGTFETGSPGQVRDLGEVLIAKPSSPGARVQGRQSRRQEALERRRKLGQEPAEAPSRPVSIWILLAVPIVLLMGFLLWRMIGGRSA